MRNDLKVLNLNELASELNLPSSKGYKTHKYLEKVIDEIEKQGLGFVQFLQLIDVLYVIIRVPSKKYPLPADKFRPEEEIHSHYQTATQRPMPDVTVLDNTEAIETDSAEKFDEAIETVKSRDHLRKNMSGAKLPWKKSGITN